MINFLFWNIAKKDLTHRIRRLVDLHAIDVLILAESMIPDAVILGKLNDKPEPEYYCAPGLVCDRLSVFARFSPEFLAVVNESERMTIRALRLPNCPEVLIAAIHMPSKREWDDPSQDVECTALAEDIRCAENKVGHSRTVLVGDFNMNPFQGGMVAARGLHGVMTRQTAMKLSSTVQARGYKFFYNPMWGFFGDRDGDPPGTHYYEKAVHRVFFWNIFDQVLVRPELLDCFNTQDVAILDSDGTESLVDAKGRPDKRKASDHLPIKFALKLLKGDSP